MAAPHDLDARPVALDDEGGDAARVGVARHHDVEFGQGAVRAPQLLAVEGEGGPVFRALGGGRESGGVRTHIVLGEREGADGSLGEAGEVRLLLRLGAEHLERLPHADRLMSGEEGDDVAVHGTHDPHRVGVLRLVEPEAAVLLRHLDAERAALGERPHDLGRDLAVPVDAVRIHLVAQEDPQVLRPRAGALGDEVVRVGIGVDRVEPELPEKEVPDEGSPRPVGLARGFGDLPGLGLADVGFRARVCMCGHVNLPLLQPDMGTPPPERRHSPKLTPRPALATNGRVAPDRLPAVPLRP